jgi:ferritin-like metal-binding protein YciE
MAFESLKDLYVDELKDAYNAEKQLMKALPKMAKQATATELRSAFEEHLKVTEGHVQRIEQIFSEMGLPARGKTCKGIQGIIEEGKEFMEAEAQPMVMDAGLIASGQRAEHYEIAAYGTLRTYAELLGYQSAASLLQQTLAEEKEADQKLSQIAETSINVEAVNGEDSETMGNTSRPNSRNGKTQRTNGMTSSRR